MRWKEWLAQLGERLQGALDRLPDVLQPPPEPVPVPVPVREPGRGAPPRR